MRYSGTVQGLGKITPLMENEMDKNREHEMGTEVYYGPRFLLESWSRLKKTSTWNLDYICITVYSYTYITLYHTCITL